MEKFWSLITSQTKSLCPCNERLWGLFPLHSSRWIGKDPSVQKLAPLYIVPEGMGLNDKFIPQMWANSLTVVTLRPPNFVMNPQKAWHCQTSKNGQFATISVWWLLQDLRINVLGMPSCCGRQVSACILKSHGSMARWWNDTDACLWFALVTVAQILHSWSRHALHEFRVHGI